jgi:hypothetical protein
VQHHPAAGGQRVLDGTAGQLVAERHGLRAHLQHAAPLAVGEQREIAQQRPRQRQLELRGNDGELLQRVPHRAVQPSDAGEHGVHDGRRNAVRRRRQRLGDEERVAAGERVERGGGDRGAPRPPRYGGAGERAQRQPADLGTAQPEDAVQRVPGADLVVAVGHEQHRGQVLDAASDVAQHVDRRIVGPVDVLHDQHARSRQLRGDRRQHRLPIPRRQGLGQRVAAAGRIAQRAERARGQQVVARSGQQPDAVQPAHEGTDQAGLTDSGLAEDQDHASAAGLGLRDRRAQLLQLGTAFEQLIHTDDRVSPDALPPGP